MEEKKTTKVFVIIPLDDVNKRASETPRRTRKAFNKEAIEAKVLKLSANKLNMKYEQFVLSKEDSVAVPGHSINDFLNECHADIRKFIDTNGLHSVVARAGQLVVVTKNRFRITIDVVSRFVKDVLIKDNKGNAIYKGKQFVYFK